MDACETDSHFILEMMCRINREMENSAESTRIHGNLDIQRIDPCISIIQGEN